MEATLPEIEPARSRLQCGGGRFGRGDLGIAQVGGRPTLKSFEAAVPVEHPIHTHRGKRSGRVVATAVLLDFAVSANLVFGQRAIYALGAEERGRLNGLFMATFFAGGAAASALAGWVFSRWNWVGVVVFGAALPLVALAYLATDRTPARA